MVRNGKAYILKIFGLLFRKWAVERLVKEAIAGNYLPGQARQEMTGDTVR